MRKKLTWSIVILSLGLSSCKAKEPLNSTVTYRERDKEGRVLRWSERRVALFVHSPEPGFELGYKEIVDAVKKAALKWTVGSRLTIDVKRSFDRRRTFEEDGVNGLFFQQKHRSDSKYRGLKKLDDPNRSGLTSIFPRQRFQHTDETSIQEADIEINAVDFSFDNQEGGLEKLEAVLLHELGHFIGLAHNCAPSKWHGTNDEKTPNLPLCSSLGEKERMSVMYPYPLEEGRRMVLNPSDDERKTVEAIYGEGNVTSPSQR